MTIERVGRLVRARRDRPLYTGKNNGNENANAFKETEGSVEACSRPTIVGIGDPMLAPWQDISS